MAVSYFWGDDQHRLFQAVAALRQQVVAPAWEGFNYEKIAGDAPDALEMALSLARTPPFGEGGRLTWVAETTLDKQCPPEVATRLAEALPSLPENSHLLFTSAGRPSLRLKSTQLIQQHGTIQEFGLIPPWKTDELQHYARQQAQDAGVALTPAALNYLVDAVGNDAGRLQQELLKLHFYGLDRQQPLEESAVRGLVNATTQTSLALAQAIRQGQVQEALDLLAALQTHYEPPLRIVATLISQFRLWLWVKLLRVDPRVDKDRVLAATQLGNPKRLYFLEQEIKSCPYSGLEASLGLLLELELALKQGVEPWGALQQSTIRLVQALTPSRNER